MIDEPADWERECVKAMDKICEEKEPKRIPELGEQPWSLPDTVINCLDSIVACEYNLYLETVKGGECERVRLDAFCRALQAQVGYLKEVEMESLRHLVHTEENN